MRVPQTAGKKYRQAGKQRKKTWAQVHPISFLLLTLPSSPYA
jgi:hypothetical protein